MRILFVCGKNRLRSPTAEHHFATWPNVETDSVGVNHDADQLVSVEHLRWAELIVAMERTHVRKLRQRFASALGHVRVVCLDIPDRYAYMEPALLALLEQRMARWLPAR